MVDGIPIAIASSETRANSVSAYVQGYGDGSDINDGKIKKVCDAIRLQHGKASIAA